MSEENVSIVLKDINENNDKIGNLAYSNVLNNIIGEIKNLNKNLSKQQNNISFLDTMIKHPFITGCILFSVSRMLHTLLNINLLISLVTINVPYFVIWEHHSFKKELISTKITALKEIKQYLKSEQEIAKNMEYTLSYNIIYQLENFIQNDIKNIKSSKKNEYIESTNYKYVEGYRKNLIILDTIHNLNDNQKKKYLADLYSAINNCKVFNNENMNNMINKNLSNLKLAADILDSDDETLNHQNNPKLQSSNNHESQNSDKPISLRKEDYNLPYDKDENGILCINGDPMPPMFQEEKGHQFSKKLPFWKHKKM